MVLTLTWMPWIEFLSGRTCILLWILYGNMVDFSFIVSLYISELLNVLQYISTSSYPWYRTVLYYEYCNRTVRVVKRRDISRDIYE